MGSNSILHAPAVGQRAFVNLIRLGGWRVAAKLQGAEGLCDLGKRTSPITESGVIA